MIDLRYIFGNEFIFIKNKFHPEDGFSFNLKILDVINSIKNIRDYLIKNYFISSIKDNKIELDTNQIFNNCFRPIQYIWPSEEGER